MEIEKFINETLVDFYCNMCEIEGMSESDIDTRMTGVDGLEASDIEVITTYTDEIDDEMIHDEVYCFVKETYDERDITVESLVSFLVSKYFTYHYEDKNNEMIEFIKKASLDELIEKFDCDDEFGRKTIEAHIHSIAEKERFLEIRNKIFQNNDQDVLTNLEFKALGGDVISLNDLLRNVICNLYNFYIENAYGDIDALNYTWQYFLRNFDPLGELDKMGFDQKSKMWYKHYMLCLIYADLYEDTCNTSIIQSENYDDRLADVLPLIMIQMGVVSVPQEEDIRNRVLKHFILLCDEKEKKKDNRQKTYSDNRINVLKKANPLYFLDEMSFGK